MFVEERKQKILNILKQKEKVNVNELSELFSISKVIVRKDLCQMEEDGLLTRTHGGAIFKKKLVDSNVLKDIVKEELECKTDLAQKIILSIKEGDIIFLDDSDISIIVASILQKKKIKITVISNRLEVQKILSRNNDIKLISLSGIYNPKTDSFIGDLAIQSLKKFNLNKVFIEARGINVDRMQLSTISVNDGELKKTALNFGKELFIVASSDKFFQDSIYNFYSLKEGMNIITDSKLCSNIEKTLIEKNIHIIKGDYSKE
ncbi:DeoR/GlpR family DNA-binding transcription regulator [Cetobacterium sp.]|uniref:DeoR/GlpR family DNA-binding transcription regulator n=1 Tax=Cetobacterium sp. TaxID=2071632 RepID=UPI002FCBA9FE